MNKERILELIKEREAQDEVFKHMKGFKNEYTKLVYLKIKDDFIDELIEALIERNYLLPKFWGSYIYWKCIREELIAKNFHHQVEIKKYDFCQDSYLCCTEDASMELRELVDYINYNIDTMVLEYNLYRYAENFGITKDRDFINTTKHRLLGSSLQLNNEKDISVVNQIDSMPPHKQENLALLIVVGIIILSTLLSFLF